ncbi:PepSY domain-containing protein [Actinomadura sp. 9N407]|uniref:PepSY domain-containing protein n=1 Tax=Actinomadura sp. 9N407 TaxID=3375154 RepID=UPI00378E84A4
MKKILITVAAAGVLVAGGAATAYAGENDDRGDVRAADVKVTAEQAASAALKAVPGGKIESLELDDDDDDNGKAAWEADVLTGNTWRDVVVDATTGKATVRTDKDDDDQDDRDDAKALNAAKIDATQAARTALQTAKGTVTSVELDDGDAWQVEVTGTDGKERELDVNATSGKVTANTVDDDSGDDDKGDDNDDDDSDDGDDD